MTREDLTLAALLAIAVLLISFGGALIYLPVGLLAGGALLLLIVAAYVRGASREPDPAPPRARRPRPRDVSNVGG